jgi:hypothetical protein
MPVSDDNPIVISGGFPDYLLGDLIRLRWKEG